MNEELKELQEGFADFKQNARQYLYYIIIGLVSVVFTVFLPLVGSEGDLASKFPTTAAGWLVWVVTNLTTSVLNCVIYYCLMEQGHLNVKEHPKYLEAEKILEKVESVKRKNPRSPKQWKKKEYTVKGVIVFCSTLLSFIGLTNMILRWDIEIFLVYLFAIIVAIAFGLIQMKKAELYWTDEYNEYAHFMFNKQEEERKLKAANERKPEEVKKNVRKKTVSKHSRTSRKE